MSDQRRTFGPVPHAHAVTSSQQIRRKLRRCYGDPGCDSIYIDKAGGKLAKRPELDKALLSANREGDQIVVTKLDRLGRSVEHLIQLSKALENKGVDLMVLDQGIDTSTAIGHMFFQILGVIAEFEHALMSERTMDGLAAARARPDRRPESQTRPPASRTGTADVRRERRERQAHTHRPADRRRVRRHPPHHLPPPGQGDPILTRSNQLIPRYMTPGRSFGSSRPSPAAS
ncbi:recombinase family protein [Saccharopolyspora shandongensis]|uniref:recombinase family protein n=1 Tax=Saccharopolyspora shandongensis TaxID=418495 RepID=UPI000A5AD78C|nr:recombinase family protein [Saccharopolyspora shandongensis]